MLAVINSKKRRGSGRTYNKFYDPEHGEYNEQHWDDWNDHRDGFRDLSDQTQKKPKHLKTERWCCNIDLLGAGYKKIKKLLLRRKSQSYLKKLKESNNSGGN